MDALKNNRPKQTAAKYERVRNEYKRLIDIGSDSTASVEFIAKQENCSMPNIFDILAKAGLTGPNGYVKQKLAKTPQPA